MENCYLVSFLLINAIFWSFFPHIAHCDVLNSFNKTFKMSIKCPSHDVHLIMGIVFYFLTLYFTQQRYFHSLMN